LTTVGLPTTIKRRYGEANVTYAEDTGDATTSPSADPSPTPTNPYPAVAPIYSAPPAAYSAPPFAYPYATYPPPVAPQRRGWAGIVVGVAVGFLVGAVCGGSGVVLALRSHPLASAPSAVWSTAAAGDQPSATPSPSPTGSHFTGDLRTLLLKPPSTSHPFAKPLSTDGNFTEDQVAAGFEDTARIKEILDEDQFVKGAVEEWHDADDTQVIIRIYQFANADFAQSWLDSNSVWYAEDTTLKDDGVIDGASPSDCFATKAVDSLGFMSTIGLTVRNDLYLSVRVFQYKTRNRAIAVNIMKSQYARLP
jgi:hypothetical protein